MKLTPRGFVFWMRGVVDAARAQGELRCDSRMRMIAERLEEVEIPPLPPQTWCGWCGQERTEGHAPECPEQKLLTEGLVEP